MLAYSASAIILRTSRQNLGKLNEIWPLDLQEGPRRLHLPDSMEYGRINFLKWDHLSVESMRSYICNQSGGLMETLNSLA